MPLPIVKNKSHYQQLMLSINIIPLSCYFKPTAMNDEKMHLGIKTGPMFSAFGRIMKTRIKQIGIPYTLEQLVMLKKISDTNDTLVQQDIAEWMAKDKSVILRIVDVLEKDGLLTRRIDPQDRRRNILEITPNGEMVLGQLCDLENIVSNILLQDIPKDEVRIFFKVTDQIRQNAERLGSELSK